jgi:acyl-homoserine lactone acylase PvdQ
MVVDLANPAKAKATAAGGQSGYPASPHYKTQSELWLNDDYHPLLMDRKDIERNLDGRLTLTP